MIPHELFPAARHTHKLQYLIGSKPFA